MDFKPTSEKESKDFVKLSNLIESGKYKEALAAAKKMLIKYPQNMHVYHNQIGAMEFMASQNYYLASDHYYIALQNGFDKDTCEDNIWEAAEIFYQSLKTESGEYNAIFNPDTQEFYHSTILIERYLKNFPKGKYNTEADKYLKEYESKKG